MRGAHEAIGSREPLVHGELLAMACHAVAQGAARVCGRSIWVRTGNQRQGLTLGRIAT